jgi:hypothetical protein
MALGTTQPLTEMSTKNLPGGISGDHHHLWADWRENVGASTSHNPMGLHGLLQEYIYLLTNYESKTDCKPEQCFSQPPAVLAVRIEISMWQEERQEK